MGCFSDISPHLNLIFEFPFDGSEMWMKRENSLVKIRRKRFALNYLKVICLPTLDRLLIK